MASRYQILDEPMPGPLAAYAVNPMWPLLAQMLGGTWLALPWYAFNGFALGSPTRVREAVLAGAGLLGGVAVSWGLIFLGDSFAVKAPEARYLLIVLVIFKLAVAYLLYIQQRRTFGLFEYYGGRVRNPLLVLVAAAILRPMILEKLQSLDELLLFLALV